MNAHFRSIAVFVMSKGRIAFFSCLFVGVLGACSPPPAATLQECRLVAVQRSVGKSLSQDDLGELTEECMASKGFLLNREGDQCGHNRSSETTRQCYYQSTMFGKLGHRLADFSPL
jgi:hypothetical protein